MGCRDGYVYYLVSEDHDSLLDESAVRTAMIYFRWKLPR
jgi:hypothetical protein